MPVAQLTRKKPEKPTNHYFVDEELLKLVPPYLKDASQTPTPVLCETEGEWPKWIAGSLVRVGTGRATVPLSEDGSKPPAILQHFFDLLGMLHKFDIANGKVRYNSRYTTEGVTRDAIKNGRLTNLMSFGVNANGLVKDQQDPCQALLGKQQSLFIPQGHLEPDAINFNITVRRGFSLPKTDNPYSKEEAPNPIADELVVQTEGPYFQVCDSKTLEPKRLLRYTDVDPQLKGHGTCAHHAKDRSKGEIFNYLVSDKGQLTLYGLDIKTKPAKLMWQTVLPAPPCYCHSLGLTKNFVVFIRNPIMFNPNDLDKKQFIDAFEYDSDCPTYFFIVDRVTGEHLATYKGANFMFFHALNAYDYVDPETGYTNVHVDLCSYDGQDSQIIALKEYSLSNVIDPIKPFEQSYPVRYECENVFGQKAVASRGVFVDRDLSDVPRASVKRMIDQPMELPRINTLYSRNSSYRYAYGVGGTGKPCPGTSVPIGRMGSGVKFVQLAFFASVCKIDWETGTSINWHPPNGESGPCEPIFVPAPNQKSEDDGCVLTIVLDREGKHSILVCLDAKTMTEIARAHMPHTFALAPHGTFVDGDSMFSAAL